MKHTLTALALVLTFSTAQAGEMLTPGQDYCTGLNLGWSTEWLKCVDLSTSAKLFARDVKRYERRARTAATPDLALMFRNKAAFSKAEAERMADKWRRKFGTK